MPDCVSLRPRCRDCGSPRCCADLTAEQGAKLAELARVTAERDAARARVERMDTPLGSACERLSAENARLRAALEVYADRRNWLGDADEVCNEWWRLSDGLRFDEDGWATAEAALRGEVTP